MTESVLTALALARSEFARRLTAVAPAQWTGTTPCTDWDVRALVNHVVGQEHRFARNMAGGSLDEYIATRDTDFLGADPVAAWEAGLRALDAAIAGLPGLDAVIEWRVPLPARDLLGLRIFEATVHTWDLSRAVGFDDRLDPHLVNHALGAVDRIRAVTALAAFFAEPDSALDPDAHPQSRLLVLAGRPVAS